MASAKLRSAATETLEDMEMDMSSMIDLVFLLLIFFMVASNLIIVEIDESVKPPVADKAKPAENAEGRIVVNIREDGTVTGVDSGEVLSEPDGPMDEVEAYVGEARDFQVENGYRPKLHVRADYRCEVKRIKAVVKAAANAQVIDVIFASFVDAKYQADQ